MNKYDSAIFDVDGTLLDTTEGVLAAVRYTIKAMGLKSLDEETLLTFIGPPIQDSFFNAYGVEGKILQQLTTIFRNRYKEVELFKARPYENIYTVCDTLLNRGVRIAIATYKRQDYAESILKHFGFDKYTSIMYGADQHNKLKKVDIIRKCLDELGAESYLKAVMIGDSSHDAIGAEQSDMDFIGVTYGFGFKTYMDVMENGAVGSADTTMDILNFFKGGKK